MTSIVGTTGLLLHEDAHEVSLGAIAPAGPIWGHLECLELVVDKNGCDCIRTVPCKRSSTKHTHPRGTEFHLEKDGDSGERTLTVDYKGIPVGLLHSTVHDQPDSFTGSFYALAHPYRLLWAG